MCIHAQKVTVHFIRPLAMFPNRVFIPTSIVSCRIKRHFRQVSSEQMPPLFRYNVDTVEGAIWLPCLLFGLCAGRFDLRRMCNGTEQMESSNHCCHCRRAGEYVRPLGTGRKETCNVPDLSNHNKSSSSQLHLNLTRVSNVNSYRMLAIVWEPPSLGLRRDMQMTQTLWQWKCALLFTCHR